MNPEHTSPAKHSKEALDALCTAKNARKRQAGRLGVKWQPASPPAHGEIMIYFCVLPLV